MAVGVTRRGLTGMRLGLVDNTIYIATQRDALKRLTGMERIDPPTYDGEDDLASTFQLKRKLTESFEHWTRGYVTFFVGMINLSEINQAVSEQPIFLVIFLNIIDRICSSRQSP